jgi:hypothetical protein
MNQIKKNHIKLKKIYIFLNSVAQLQIHQI